MLEEWFSDLRQQPRMTLPEPIRVMGILNKHLGPRWNFAQVEVSFEPSDTLSVEIEVNASSELPERYLQAAVFGMLDVLLTQASLPVLDVHMRIINAVADPVRSTEHSFRMAGRHAAQQVIGLASVPGYHRPARPDSELT